MGKQLDYKSWVQRHPSKDERDFFIKRDIHTDIQDKGSSFIWYVWTLSPSYSQRMLFENVCDTEEEATKQMLVQALDVYRARKRRGYYPNDMRVEGRSSIWGGIFS